MIYWNDNSLLFATGLPLRIISKVITSVSSDEEIEVMLKNYGEKYLKRYQIAKEYAYLRQNGIQKLPYIILLAGIPGVGKTALAKELSTALNISIVIGGDSLRSSMRAILHSEGNEALFRSIYDVWKLFGKKTQENVIQGFKSQAMIMNKAIQYMVVDRGLRDGESLIVEYLHFLPSHFESEILTHPSIIPLVFRINDLNTYEERIKSRGLYSHLKSSGDRLLEHIDDYLLIQKHQCSEAKAHNVQIIDIDDFNNAIDSSLEYILSRIHELNSIRNYDKTITFIDKIVKERKT